MDEKPFDRYELELFDEDIYVVATDDDAPRDEFRARFTVDELAPLLRRINRALRRT